MKEKIIAQPIQQEIILELLAAYQRQELSTGQILKILRKDIMEMSQTEYAKMIGISRRTLSDLEQDLGSPTFHIFNAAFKPFGLQAGLVPLFKN
ncbi:helix-turn-helix transcriptional regulator [Bowmanella yangjiangensis]|uniref:Helix-turn-helix transcriptional regulator n=1 Tax=Bowmanella yangjiangensis TaxID=2811230 RepID=A0ABS3CX29_9ALTE|nr:helix-turn-helix transcriptional regulator [Bowmanella yangjiangensis]MBN7821668.1 helix-turn-helix transcriptional regulator [Bowmanella yangjiangensis]